ncbi:MAG: hypothetical protein M1829_003499 [Trizodia sp. TS-e1964]|nr:MAG: hypothetical protein M1829_003499 [Trizodia sp. TS-e1964]
MSLKERLQLDRAKLEKKEQEGLKREQKRQDDYLYSEQRKHHQMGVEARKLEKSQIKELAELRACGSFISHELYLPIIDPKIAWNASYGEAYADLKQRNKRKKPEVALPNTLGSVDTIGDVERAAASILIDASSSDSSELEFE